MLQQVGGIFVDPVGARAFQFRLSVAAAKQTHAQGFRAARGEQVPNAVSNVTARPFDEVIRLDEEGENFLTRWGERWDLNPRPSVPQTDALPTELRSPQIRSVRFPACYSTAAGTAKSKQTQALVAGSRFPAASKQVMYRPITSPTRSNVMFRALASDCIPAVAAKVTRARSCTLHAKWQEGYRLADYRTSCCAVK